MKRVFNLKHNGNDGWYITIGEKQHIVFGPIQKLPNATAIANILESDVQDEVHLFAKEE